MRRFQSMPEMIEYGRKKMGKYDYEKVLFQDKVIILCGTDAAYESGIWNSLHKEITDFFTQFSAVLENDICKDDRKNSSDTVTDTASELRDIVIRNFEDFYGVQFINVWKAY